MIDTTFCLWIIEKIETKNIKKNRDKRAVIFNPKGRGFAPSKFPNNVEQQLTGKSGSISIK